MARADASDRFMVNLPMFHSGGVVAITSMLICGGSFMMVDSYDTDSILAVCPPSRYHHRGLAGRHGRLSSQATVFA